MTIPCKNCLVWSICKNKAVDLNEGTSYVSNVFNECSLLHEYAIQHYRKDIAIVESGKAFLSNYCSELYTDLFYMFAGYSVEARNILLSVQEIGD